MFPTAQSLYRSDPQETYTTYSVSRRWREPPMEKDGAQRYAASLEQVVRSTHQDLREAMIQFQGYSQRVTAQGTVASGTVTDIRKVYKEIQDQLAKIRGANQLL